MKHIPHAFIACLLAYAFGHATASPADTTQTNLPLTPVFLNTQGFTPATIKGYDLPRFAFTFTPTEPTVNGISNRPGLYYAMATASAILDSKEYPASGFAFSASKSQGKTTYASTLSLNNFVPRTQGKTTLAEGIHTLIFHMGGKTYGPVTFLWQLPGAYIPRTLTPSLALTPIFVNTQGRT